MRLPRALLVVAALGLLARGVATVRLGPWPDAAAFAAATPGRRIASWDGHERLFLDAFRGRPPDPAPAALPAPVAVARGVGALTQDPRALLLLPWVAGGGSVLAAGVAVARRAGRRAGVAAALVWALHPAALAWSTSILPVSLGIAALSVSFAVRRPLPAALAAAVAGALRPELALAALLRGGPGLAAAGAAALSLGMAGAPPAADPWISLRFSAPLLGAVAPAALWVLAACGARHAPRALGAAVLLHLAFAAALPDYGDRHGLAVALLLLLPAGAAAARRPWLGALAVLALAAASAALLAGLGPRPPSLTPPAHPLPDAPQAGCVELGDEPPIPGQPLPPATVAFATAPPDCAVWAETALHQAWSSRGLHDRARRIRASFALEPVAYTVPGPHRERLVHRLRLRAVPHLGFSR